MASTYPECAIEVEVSKRNNKDYLYTFHLFFSHEQYAGLYKQFLEETAPAFLHSRKAFVNKSITISLRKKSSQCPTDVTGKVWRFTTEEAAKEWEEAIRLWRKAD